MLEKIKKNRRKLTIIGIILLITVILIVGTIIANKIGKNNKTRQIAKAEGEYGYDKPYIPEGFDYIEGAWNTGYVIREIETGNEFVWVPIDGESVKLERKNYTKINETDVSKDECKEEIDEVFEESVEKYGGYYVGRYEAGVPIGTTFETEEEMNINGKPVSKKGATVWNNINYKNAKTSAERMYGTKSEITSSIMNSYAYDALLTWIEAGGNNVETDSKDWGNYSNNSNTNHQVEEAGKSESWKAKNIYDLAGNVKEWTSEENAKNKVCRGGSYYNDGNISPAATREAQPETQVANNLGFRVIMYKTGNPTIEGYDDPYVPEGFTHTEGEWNTGFVIRENETGNEFVWIPVDGYNLNLDRSEFEKTPSSMAKSTDTLETGFKLSVYTYGGYYVGRYEAGIGETSGDNIGVPVSKKGVETWTNISQTNATDSAKKMYEENSQVTSKLMSSYAYDTMLNWLKKQDYSTKTYNVDNDSSTWGNYRNSGNTKQVAGSNENWKANNIYDIAGNVWEWTTEKYGQEAVARGGDYKSNRRCITSRSKRTCSRGKPF